jgi:hypothetical protein
MSERITLVIDVSPEEANDIADELAKQAISLEAVSQVRCDLASEWDCPNCGQRHGPVDECLLALAVGIYQDRHDGSAPPRHVLESIDPDAIWSRFGGPLVDWLESQVADVDR